LTCCTYPCMSCSALHSAGWIHMANQAVSLDTSTYENCNSSDLS
jgi:hypothetical protein